MYYTINISFRRKQDGLFCDSWSKTMIKEHEIFSTIAEAIKYADKQYFEIWHIDIKLND